MLSVENKNREETGYVQNSYRLRVKTSRKYV